MKFEYALVQAKNIPSGIRENLAFSHCLFDDFKALLLGKQYAMSRGSWLLFVIYDTYPNMPELYIEYAAVHERGEQVTLGNHNLASKLEFAIAKKENKIVKYMKWLEKYYPAKFADVFSYQTHLEFSATDKLQKVLELSFNSDKAAKVRQIIEEFEWPYHLLQKLTLYKKKNEEIIKIATHALCAAEILTSQCGMSLKELISRIRNEVAKQLHFIAKGELKRYISFPRLEVLWHELRINLDNKFVKTLNARQRTNPNHLQELLDAGLSDSLPKDGVLSLSFKKALQAL